MKTIKKNVYYCDFCKKHTLTPQSMRLHEAHCTANPNRTCRLCDGGGVVLLNKEAVKPRFHKEAAESGDDISIKAFEQLQNDVDGCPACILASIRQAGLQQYSFDYQSAALGYLKEREE